MFWRLKTDKQFIADVWRWHRRRRMCGAVLLVLGLACLAMAYTAFNLEGSRRTLAAVTYSETAAIDTVLHELSVETAFVVGRVLGFVSGKVYGVGFMVAVFGVGMLCGADRKSQLLLRLWDSSLSDDSTTEGSTDLPIA